MAIGSRSYLVLWKLMSQTLKNKKLSSYFIANICKMSVQEWLER